MRRGVVVTLVLALALVLSQTMKSRNSPTHGSQKVLTLYAMSNYFPSLVISNFEKTYNCKVRYDNFSNNEELLAKLQAGVSGYDVIVPSDYSVRILIGSRLLLPLDKTKIPNVKNVASEFANAPYDESGTFTVPYAWGTTGLIYNKQHVPDTVNSWDILFDKKYAGHVSLLDDQREVMGALLHKLGFSTNSMNEKELKEAKQLLIDLKKNIRLFSSDPKQHLLSGDIWIAHIYSGDARQVMRGKTQFEYVTPKEGGTIWADTLAIPANAKNPDLAHQFLNYILDQTVAKTTTEEILYSSPNASLEDSALEDFLKPSYLKKLPMTQLEYLQDLGAAGSVLNQLWIEAKSY